MQTKYLTILIGVFVTAVGYAQPFDLVLNSSESGTVVHQAINSISFEPGYSYSPNGGTMLAEIVEPVFNNISYNYTVINPENRSLNTSYLAGTSTGTFNVNSVGAATYNIPIDVPSGVAGLQPDLSITYNSMAGPGVVGYGWNVSGISVITRSPRSFYYDGTALGIELTSNDRFSLDGQRLICTSGSYGGNSSQYRTENDIFTRVTCYTGSYGPTQFLAETKNGLDCQYGYTNDADQMIEGYSEVVNWYVNKITDLYGNQINYGYVRNNGSVYLAQITYGPNTISFSYKQRSDKTTRYLKGSKIEQNLLLESIEIKYNSNVVKKYEFKYNYPSSNYTRYSLLNEVIEYGIGGSRLNSMVFSYQSPDGVDFEQTTYNTTHAYISNTSKLYIGDFNGDGLDDVFTIDDPDESGSYSGWKMFKNNGDDTFSLQSSGDFSIPEEEILDIVVSDLNSDGKDDLLILRNYNLVIPELGGGFPVAMYYYAISNGASFSDVDYFDYNINTRVLSAPDKRLGDFNGDGINDCLIYNGTGSWKLYSMDMQTNNMDLVSSGTLTSVANDDIILASDFNGDGKFDLWLFNSSGLHIYTLNGSSMTQIYSSTIPGKDHYFRLGDFNADGKADLFIYGYDTYDWSNWQVRLSTGTSFQVNYIASKKSNLKDDVVRIGDFNGDGATDLMVNDDVANGWGGRYYYITKNQGTDFYSVYDSRLYPYPLYKYYLNDFNGDGRTDFLCTAGEYTWTGYMIYKSGNKNQILLDKLANGLNDFKRIDYAYLSQASSSVYTKGSGANFPVYDYQGALPVVSSIVTDNGIGSRNTINYSYQGAKIHRQGKGFLCYAKTTIADVANNQSTESNYDYHTSYYFPKLTSIINRAGSTTMSTTNNLWSYITTTMGIGLHNSIFPYVSSSTQTNNLTGHSVNLIPSYDTYGNVTSQVKSFNNGVTETTVNVYDNNATYWWLGRLTSSSISYAKSGESTINRTVSCTYTANGMLKPDFVRYFEGTSLYHYKNYDYSSNGNVVQLSEYATGVGTRTTTHTYEANGVRLKTTTDPLAHTTTNNYDSYGRLSSEVDYLNNTASFSYDNLGRVTTATQPDGASETTSYGWGLTGGPGNACYYIQQLGNDGSYAKTWYDKLNREIRTDTRGFNGSYIYAVTEYNTKGQVYRISEPSTSTSPTQWNTHTYDAYGRIDYITRPSGRNTDYAYSNNRVTETTGGKASWKETDSQGQITQSHDNGGDIVYAYYPDGKVKSVTVSGSAVTSMEYDLAGNQTKLIDPSAGTINYTYNAFGELLTQTNARSQTATYNYYTDGRLSNKVTPEGTTAYGYNSNEQLTSVTSPGSVSRSYGYDTKGRINSISETIPGSSALTTSFTFDSYGRLQTQTHPSGIVETMHYNTNGYLESVSAGGGTRWTVTGMNARQQITTATYGSNLDVTFGFDAYGYPNSSKAQANSVYKQDYRYSFNGVTGNLNSRQNYLRSKSESFAYDNLDRLTGVTGPQNLTMDYDNKGNIVTKSDVGTNAFVYNISGKPYMLSQVTSSTGLIPSAKDTATYTSFEQASTIDEGDYHATFTYNSDGQRCKMQVTDLGNTILSRWYAGSRYIKQTEGATTKEYTWIGGDAYSAPAVAVTTGGSTTWYYLLRDYLGNITHVVDASNNVTAEYNFDPWGRRRDKDTWSYTLSSEPDLFAGRGFTGHEHLPWFNLINMNGRLYDPLVGRFLSVDENLQMPDFTQNFNRYSYALNNPLVYTDPNGEFIFTLLSLIIPGAQVFLPIGIGADIGAITGGIRGANTDGMSFWGGAWRGAVVGGMGGSLSMVGGAGMSFANNLFLGINEGALTGGLDAALWGRNIGKGMFWGAVSGAAFTTLTSENFKNWTKGKGFYNNQNVFGDFDKGKYTVEGGVWQQDALDYFGFEGKYYPDRYDNDAWFTPQAGIGYSNGAFTSFDDLKSSYYKESFEKISYLNKTRAKLDNPTGVFRLDIQPQELRSHIRLYRNQGLYPNVTTDLMKSIRSVQGFMRTQNLLSETTIFNMNQYGFEKKWWHFIYKIPRRY